MSARLGRYVVLKHIASDGIVDVALGRSDGTEGLERHVVLKRVRRALARDQQFIHKFLDEARAVAALRHPHLAQIHEVGESGGEYFLAMEYVHGEDVRRILARAARQRTHVPLGHAIAFVSAAAAGLHHAHEHRGNDDQPLGIVHRDVSPSNIRVGYDGSIKVVDFGIAVASAQQETRSGSLNGKLSYMSPEQCRGDTVDRRCDVYALGVVLYELVTTTRMIRGENDYVVIDQIVTGQIQAPQIRRPGLPTGLSEIIMRALATDRERRYASADEFRAALEQCASSAGLASSAASIAAFMRQQFGQRPEPLLGIDAPTTAAFEPAQTLVDEAPPSQNGWIELWSAERGDAVPEQVDLLDVLPGDTALLSNTPPTTTARMGWESRPHRQPPRSSWMQKAAVAAGALAAGVAIWFAARLVDEPSTQATTLSVAAPLSNAALIPPPPPPPAPVPVETVTAAQTSLPPTTTVVAVAPSADEVPPAALEANRIAGQKQIAPDEIAMDAIARAGHGPLVGSYKVCITAHGAISSVTQLYGSGVAGYDNKIRATIRKEWRFRPFLVNGKASPVCSDFQVSHAPK